MKLSWTTSGPAFGQRGDICIVDVDIDRSLERRFWLNTMVVNIFMSGLKKSKLIILSKA